MKAKRFIETHSSDKPDSYTLAVIANFAVHCRDGNEQDRELTSQSMHALVDARTEKDDMVSWNAEETGVYSTDASAAIETTGLAEQALLKWGRAAESTRKALSFISSKKQASGTWGTTQATIMALRALLLASQLSTSDVHGSAHITVNGKLVETLQLTKDNNDLLHQFVFKGGSLATVTTSDKFGNPASVQLSFEGTGGFAYQVVGRYFTPWGLSPLDNRSRSTSLTIAPGLRRMMSPLNKKPSTTTSRRLPTWSWSIWVSRPGSISSAKIYRPFRRSPRPAMGAGSRSSLSPRPRPFFISTHSRPTRRYAQTPPAREVPHPRAYFSISRIRVHQRNRTADPVWRSICS